MQATGGHTLVEAIVALGLMALVMSGVVVMVFQTTRLVRSHPDRFELHQRARVALDLITRDLRTAGAGVYLGPATGPLIEALPAIWPRVVGRAGDAPTVARTDALTTITVPDTVAQTRSLSDVAPSSPSLLVDPAAHCSPSRPACGFGAGTTIAVFDPSGRLGLWEVDRVTGPTLLLEAVATPADVIEPGAVVTELQVRGYRHDPVTHQLRYFDADATDQPVIDGVSHMAVQYFDHLGELPPGVLNDGPWRGSGVTMFDADLLRVRRVRVRLTVTAGTASYTAVVDVALRNVGSS